jgi:hypothetical protein
MDKLSISIKKILSELAKKYYRRKVWRAWNKNRSHYTKACLCEITILGKNRYFNVGQKLPEKLSENDVPFNHTLGSTIFCCSLHQN